MERTGFVKIIGRAGFLVASLLLIACICACASADPVTLEIQADNTFWFGHFEQDNSLVNGKEPILWRILDVDWEHEYFLALSEYGLYTMNYHHSNGSTLWADTDVRDWLNHTFASSAFTADERKHIAVTEVSGSMDRFFLLDVDQVRKLLKEPFLCTASPYAVATGAYVNQKTNTSSWLLRTDVATDYIAFVGGAGALYLPGNGKMDNSLTQSDNVVRPAMWISMNEINDGEIVDLNAAPAAPQPEPEPDAEPAPPAAEEGLYASTLDSTIATRSGPSTGYSELGSYVNVSRVKVISRANDGAIVWLEVEFPYNGLTVRAYTGLKRVDVDAAAVPDDPAKFIADATVARDTTAYYGPGVFYKKQPAQFTPAAGTAGIVVKAENGWYCFEYEATVDGKACPARVWYPADDLMLD